MHCRKHLAEDICPYTCILEDCTCPQTLYVTREAWMGHMKKDHRTSQSWICFACVNPVEFSNKQDFIEHTRQQHKESVADHQILAITDMSARSTPFAINDCPLCKWAEGQEGETNSTLLLDHIAEHVHSFSLRSLPWAPTEKDEDSARINDSVARVRAWFAGWPTQYEGDENRPRHSREQTVDETDDYFENNDYFAESLGQQSAGPDFSALSEERDLRGMAGDEPLVFLETHEYGLHHVLVDSTNPVEVSQKMSQPLSVEALQAQDIQLESASQGKEGVLYRMPYRTAVLMDSLEILISETCFGGWLRRIPRSLIDQH
jgi:hypothetical protein